MINSYEVTNKVDDEESLKAIFIFYYLVAIRSHFRNTHVLIDKINEEIEKFGLSPFWENLLKKARKYYTVSSSTNSTASRRSSTNTSSSRRSSTNTSSSRRSSTNTNSSRRSSINSTASRTNPYSILAASRSSTASRTNDNNPYSILRYL